MLLFRYFIVIVFLGFYGQPLAEKITLAVAANFAAPLKKIVRIFENETNHQARISIGSSGKIYAQITLDAPFDIFFSADQSKPTRLVETGLAVRESQYTYAIGRLVLWQPKPKTYGKTNSRPRVAIANPKIAPYGIAALEVLKSLTQIIELEPKLVRGENVAQAYQFVASGATDMGFVALSQVQNEPKDSYQLIKQTKHSPIRQDMVLLNRAIDNPAAIDFMRFIKTKKIRDMIAAFGYK